MECHISNVIELELKYCERCGGLWLRPKDSDVIFCIGCAKTMAGIEPASPGGMLRQSRHHDIPEKRFWAEGGNA